jgi:hypothetical protein
LSSLLHAGAITDVDICGIATDYCVKATALDAVRLGFRARLLPGLHAGVASQTTSSALAEMVRPRCRGPRRRSSREPSDRPPRRSHRHDRPRRRRHPRRRSGPGRPRSVPRPGRDAGGRHRAAGELPGRARPRQAGGRRPALPPDRLPAPRHLHRPDGRGPRRQGLPDPPRRRFRARRLRLRPLQELRRARGPRDLPLPGRRVFGPHIDVNALWEVARRIDARQHLDLDPALTQPPKDTA